MTMLHISKIEGFFLISLLLWFYIEPPKFSDFEMMIINNHQLVF